MRSIELMKLVSSRAGDLLSPRVCLSCEAAIGPEGRSLCNDCWDELGRDIDGEYCVRCGEEPGAHLLFDGECTACREGQSGSIRFHRFVRVGRYDGVLKRLILQFKHRFTLDDLLGGLMASAIAGAIDPTEVDYWTPIPSPWRRRLTRGFQPTMLLASRATRAFGRRPVTLLSMRRHVPPLHTMDRTTFSGRQSMVRDSFRLEPGFELKGGTVALIDDVSTTGATLAEAARTLRQGGAKRIVAVVLAKWTPNERGGTAGVDPGSSSA